MKNDTSKDHHPRDPDEHPMSCSLEKMPILIDRVATRKNEQIPDQVAEKKSNEYRARERDENLLPNGRIVEPEERGGNCCHEIVLLPLRYAEQWQEGMTLFERFSAARVAQG